MCFVVDAVIAGVVRQNAVGRERPFLVLIPEIDGIAPDFSDSDSQALVEGFFHDIHAVRISPNGLGGV